MKAKMFFLLMAITTQALFFASCGNDANNETSDDATASDTTTEAAAPSTGDIHLSPFPASTEFPNATLSWGYEKGKFLFRPMNYQLKQQTPDAEQKMCANSKDGQHVHLIIDNGPYDAVYDPTFEKAVDDGEHYMLAFLGRSYHESIKTPGAGMAYKAVIKDGSIYNGPIVNEPMLFYSRPKGKYVGKAETDKVMLDFYLTNVTLSPDGYKVKALVNGEKEFTLDKWEPVFIEGLPMGDNKVKLTLIDKDGNEVKTPLNPVERVFTLMEDPTEAQ
ncbi:MAG: phosphopeptide-binding protein [Bacteroidetes bacterium]|nr:phosphopeptide-binding protein [Bacteroidota bacterium]